MFIIKLKPFPEPLKPFLASFAVSWHPPPPPTTTHLHMRIRRTSLTTVVTEMMKPVNTQSSKVLPIVGREPKARRSWESEPGARSPESEQHASNHASCIQQSCLRHHQIA